MDGFIRESRIRIDDLGVPLFSETSIYTSSALVIMNLGNYYIVLMEEIQHHLFFFVTPVNNGISHQPQLVCRIFSINSM